jgi:hypothetical protein
VKRWGLYVNQEIGKPLFVTLLIYIDKQWHLHWDAETLFLDSVTETGVFVRPKAYRVVLMDQDILHRVSVPSAEARRPRYSVAIKLVFYPKTSKQSMSIRKKEWGKPTFFGSANADLQAYNEMRSTGS